MQKDFDGWNKLKKSLDSNARPEYFHERDIWFCSIGINIGSEQNGHNENFERPVLILKKWSNDTFVGLPLTSKLKKGNYFFDLSTKEEVSIVLLCQIRTLDRKRLLRKIDVLPRAKFNEILQAYNNLFL